MNEQKNYPQEMQALVGVACPISVTVSPAGELLAASYETDWKEGGTKAVETNKKDKAGNRIINYVEDYKNCKLTKEQIKKLDSYIAENLKK